MDSRIKAFIEKKHQERIKESIDKVLADVNNPLQKKPFCDDWFDLRRIPKDILDKNYEYYSPYRIGAACNSRLQMTRDGRYLFDSTSYEADIDMAIEDITHTFPIDEVYQVIKQRGYHNIYVALLVANKKGNVKIIIESMSKYRLFLSNETPDTVLSDGKHEWIDMRFEPVEQDDISEIIREIYSTLGHLSLDRNTESILKNGLWASNNNPVFKYPTPRLYLIEEAAAKEDIQGLAKTLYNQSLQKDIEGLIPTFVLFEIDLNKTSESIHFYWDVNEKYGVFTDSNIEASAIRVKDYINVK